VIIGKVKGVRIIRWNVMDVTGWQRGYGAKWTLLHGDKSVLPACATITEEQRNDFHPKKKLELWVITITTQKYVSTGHYEKPERISSAPKF
jgi:NADPH-dependent ferric siderophore reductase